MTVAKLLIEQIVSRHRVLAEVLSDCGRAFLSGLMREVGQFLGFHKVNTTAYHPQTDGLVKRFNHTLTEMLARTVDRDGCDWDHHLPFVLFAYRASLYCLYLTHTFCSYSFHYHSYGSLHAAVPEAP